MRRLAFLLWAAACVGIAARHVEQTPAVPAVAGPGAALDPSGFRYQRLLEAGDPGLVTLSLDAAVLAHSQGPSGSFADVRIVNAGNLQIPYVLERRDERLSLRLEPQPATPQARDLQNRPGHRSFYAITLPLEDLPGAVIELQTSAAVFRRFVQLGVERPPDRRSRETVFERLAQAVWEHGDAAAPAPALELALPVERSRELLLIVDEGDNKPLPVTGTRLLLPGWQLRFHRPPGLLRLIYGNEDIGNPRYDAAALAPSVMNGTAREASAEPEHTPAPPAAIVSPRAFWMGLAVAVVLLLGVLVRLISSATAPPPSQPGP